MRIGIIGAMDVEVELLKERLGSSAPLEFVTLGKLEFFKGAIGTNEVIGIQCGVGMVNAAVATQVLIGHFAVDAVINTGVAGSLDASIDIGDVVVATDAVNHVMDVCNLGYEPGQTPGLPVAFSCSEELAVDVLQAAESLGLRTHRGRVASGDRFVREDEDKARIRKTFNASCCEMEGAAIAQVCWANETPFVLVRAISDKADGTDHIDYPAFEARAARDCAALVIKTLETLGC